VLPSERSLVAPAARTPILASTVLELTRVRKDYN